MTVAGQAVVPIDLIHIGHWLRLLLGPPTTTGTSPNFVHTFGSGAATLPSNSIEIAYTINANRSLTVTLHEVYLALAKTPIEGPAGVEASFDFRAAFNTTAGRMMTAVLRNDQAGSVYA